MTPAIILAIAAERERQDQLHPGTSYLPNGTGGGGRETWRNIAQHACDRAAREGVLTFAHVLDEEVAEALAETDPAKLRDELIQVAAVAVKWLQALDARAVPTVCPGCGGWSVRDLLCRWCAERAQEATRRGESFPLPFDKET